MGASSSSSSSVTYTHTHHSEIDNFNVNMLDTKQSIIEKNIRKIEALIDHHKRENTRMLSEYMLNFNHLFLGYQEGENRNHYMRRAFCNSHPFKNNQERIDNLNYHMEQLLIQSGKDKYSPYFMD
jgi:hypothetical protein